MARTAGTVCLVAVLGLAAGGCAHLMETRTIARFAEAIEKKDVATLKASATSDFKHKALRHAAALDDLQVLNLPDGKVSVVKVEDISPGEKNVYVHVGKHKRKLLYKLRKEKKSGDWKVADIRVPQHRNGLVEARYVSEQMDLLLTVREFLDAWEGGSRPAILATATPELKSVLRELPPRSLSRLAKQVVGQRGHKSKFRPKATLDGKVAIVALPRKTGKMLLKMEQAADGRWNVADVAAESRTGKSLSSLLKKAVVMQTAERFLKAYAAGDKPALRKLCTSKLFTETLANAGDLAEFPLQPAGGDAADFEITQKEGRANYVLKGPRQWTRITLKEDRRRQDADAAPEFRIEDVAVYRAQNRQEVRISSFFLARAKVQLFAEALAAGNLEYLKKLSSGDFDRRVWDEGERSLLLDVRGLSSVPGQPFRAGPLRIEATDFHGPVTEVHVRQGPTDATYVLREQEGQVVVDDVLLLKYGRPRSLKTWLELALPIRKFSRAVREGDLATLQRNSSKDFNRLIWKQTRVMPSSGYAAPRFLDNPIAAVQPSGNDVLVTLGDANFGAKVLLVSEYAKYVIDDVILVAGPQPDQQARLKQRLRTQLAESGARTKGAPLAGPGAGPGSSHRSHGRRDPTPIAPGPAADLDDPGSGVRHAAHRSEAAPRRPGQSISVDPAGAAFRDAASPAP